MRFENIQTFSIDELSLDEGNYRFQHATNQKECITKIYEGSKSYFKNLMTSLADNDLGEPLLVYQDKDGNHIILDGNRRGAAIKIILDPSMAPTPALKKKAQEFQDRTTFNLRTIQAQVSDDKELILKTVYERHAAGKGVSKIDWSALANAKFRFDTKLTGDQEWHDIALLMELESTHPDSVKFIYTQEYSHEVFRRIVRAAVKEGIISKSIFVENDMRISKKSRKELSRALELAQKFLHYMENGEISLSRKGDTYADRKRINEYLARFEEVKPKSSFDEGDSNDIEEEKKIETSVSSGEGDKGDSKSTSSGDEGETGGSDNNEKLNINKPTLKIGRSPSVENLLNELDSTKLTSFYNSLITISLRQHPAVMSVSAWAFFETIARNLGSNENISFDSFLNGKASEWFKEKGKKKSIKQALKFIADEGNCNKHCNIYVSVNAEVLANHFKVLEPLLIKALGHLIEKNNNGEITQ